MRHLVRLSSPLIGLGIALAAPAPAHAQEQENPSTPGQIPDPGTYQGSTVLQQQSDQQDQQFRQQQEQQSRGYQQQYSGNYGGRSGYSGNGGGSAQMDAGIRCLTMLQRSAALAPLRGLVELGTNSRDPRYFTIPRRPTASEKPVLLRWVAARRQCPLAIQPTAVLMRANAIATEITNKLIAQLAQGLMTYGQFNYKRALNTENFIRFRDSR